MKIVIWIGCIVVASLFSVLTSDIFGNWVKFAAEFVALTIAPILCRKYSERHNNKVNEKKRLTNTQDSEPISTVEQVPTDNANLTNGIEGRNVICPSCGKSLPPDSKFCQYCGSKIQKTDASISPSEKSQVSERGRTIKVSEENLSKADKKKSAKQIGLVACVSVLIIALTGLNIYQYLSSKNREEKVVDKSVLSIDSLQGKWTIPNDVGCQIDIYIDGDEVTTVCTEIDDGRWHVSLDHSHDNNHGKINYVAGNFVITWDTPMGFNDRSVILDYDEDSFTLNCIYTEPFQRCK